MNKKETEKKIEDAQHEYSLRRITFNEMNNIVFKLKTKLYEKNE